jgi:hypothetical protein
MILTPIRAVGSAADHGDREQADLEHSQARTPCAHQARRGYAEHAGSARLPNPTRFSICGQ